MIDVQALTYQVQGKVILHGVSTQIPAGGITALIGPNGAGKSSLLHAVTGLQPIQGGRVQIDGEDPFALQDRARALRVALLQQNPDVVPRLSIRDLVGFGRWPHHQGRPTSTDTAAINEALAAFDLTELADRSLDAVSGGQRQRAMVAMTFAQGTPWMCLDEPLNALDPRYASDLMARLHQLSRPGEANRSVVVVLHDINTAARWADHVVALKDGKIFATGTPREVLTEAKLADLYETEFMVIEQAGKRAVVPA